MGGFSSAHTLPSTTAPLQTLGSDRLKSTPPIFVFQIQSRVTVSLPLFPKRGHEVRQHLGDTFPRLGGGDEALHQVAFNPISVSRSLRTLPALHESTSELPRAASTRPRGSRGHLSPLQPARSDEYGGAEPEFALQAYTRGQPPPPQPA